MKIGFFGLNYIPKMPLKLEEFTSENGEGGGELEMLGKGKMGRREIIRGK